MTTWMVAAAALMALLIAAPAAWGVPMPVKGGATRLVLNAGLEKSLRQDGIAAKPLGAAKLQGRKLTTAVARGGFEPDASNASFTLAGGLKLIAGGKSAALRGIVLDSGARTVSAKLGGKRIVLARLGQRKLARDGFDARLEAKRLPLGREGAAALNRLLGVPGALRAGRSLGSINSLGKATEVEISFGSIVIGGPGTAFSKLESLNAEMGIWGGTEAWNVPGERFFIFRTLPTRVTPDATSGTLQGEERDGISMQIFQSPPREMLLRHPLVDLGAGTLTATLSPLSMENPVRATIATLDYSGAKMQVRPRVGAFELMGLQAIANQFIADQLNQRFQTSVFQAGEPFAKVTINLHAAGI